MKTIRVTFENGDSVVTSINGTHDQIREYYIGQTFNLGRNEDCLTKATTVEFFEEKSEIMLTPLHPVVS